MLRFGRSKANTAPAQETDPRPRPETPVDKAQALMALLGEDARKMGLSDRNEGPAARIPPDHLRKMAQQLIEQVEARPRSPAPVPAPETMSPPNAPDVSEAPPPRRKLFSQLSPMVPPASAETIVATSPQPALVRKVPQSPNPSRPTSNQYGLPRAIETPRPAASRPAVLPPAAVRRLIDNGGEGLMALGEHPAIVAVTLQGRPPLEQAAALRRLPRGQTRAVHRALRLLEQTP